MVSIFLCSYRKSECFAAPGLSWLPPELFYAVEFVETERGAAVPRPGSGSQLVGVQF
jgi:hypothetical protein